MSSQNSRIAKNTLYLYVRTLLIMAVSLYTSRVVLQALGFEDFGIYYTVAGAVAMFGMLTNALSTSISRFITFELGKANDGRLAQVFSSSLRILLIVSLCVVLLGETVGLWALNHWIHIPPERLAAAGWVWQSTLFVFVLSLLSVPYNATIIAHEHMNAFAAISVLEVMLKLASALLLQLVLMDKLTVYALFTAGVALVVRLSYGAYCHRFFPECRLHVAHDGTQMRAMLSFTGYSFFNHVPYILNTQAMTLLINQFFGGSVISARGIAHQVEAAVIQLVSNFTTAVRPQITKSYAAGDHDRLCMLVCMGSKYGFFLMLFFSVPLIIEAPYVLQLWLGDVPPLTVAFMRLSLVSYLVSMLGETGYTACQATGDIRRYTLIITTMAFFPLPLTWLAFRLGGSPCYSYYTYILTYGTINVVRLVLMKQMLHFPPMLFVRQVFLRVGLVVVPAFLLPHLLSAMMVPSFFRFLFTILVSTLNTALWTGLLGMRTDERQYIFTVIKHKCKCKG